MARIITKMKSDLIIHMAPIILEIQDMKINQMELKLISKIG